MTTPKLTAFRIVTLVAFTVCTVLYLISYTGVGGYLPASTDVGNVSHLIPTLQICTASCACGTPGHSWQIVSCDGTHIGHKAALQAGRVLAAGAVDLFENPDLLKRAREEFERRTKGGFTCPIPEGAVPVVPD